MINYNIRISGVADGNHEYSFDIDDKFFESFANSEIIDANIKVVVTLLKIGKKLTLSLKINGTIYNLLCDLCAAKMNIMISNSLSILLEESNSNFEDTDEIIYIVPNQHEINISQLIYEGIIFSIPTKRNHSGRNNDNCDKEMMLLLNKYSEKEKKSDPKWNKLHELKNLI